MGAMALNRLMPNQFLDLKLIAMLIITLLAAPHDYDAKQVARRSAQVTPMCTLMDLLLGILHPRPRAHVVGSSLPHTLRTILAFYMA